MAVTSEQLGKKTRRKKKKVASVSPTSSREWRYKCVLMPSVVVVSVFPENVSYTQ